MDDPSDTESFFSETESGEPEEFAPQNEPQAYQPVDAVNGGGRVNASGSSVADDFSEEEFYQMLLDEDRRVAAAVGCTVAHNSNDAMPFYHVLLEQQEHRARVEEAVDNLRTSVPGLDEDSDVVEVFEQTVNYLMYLTQVLQGKYGPDG